MKQSKTLEESIEELNIALNELIQAFAISIRLDKLVDWLANRLI